MCWVVQLSQRRLCQVHLHTPCPPTLTQPWAQASPATLHLPGFKFSRASYLLSLLRPQIYTELELQVPAPSSRWAASTSWHTGRVSLLPGCPCREGLPVPVLQRHGLRVLPRDPYSFTPLLEDRSPPRSLLLGHNMAQTQQQIAQFSQKDAQVLWEQASGIAKPPRCSPTVEQQGCSRVGYPLRPPWHSSRCRPSDLFQAYPEYEAFMEALVSALNPLLDAPPVDTAALGGGSLLQRLRALRALRPLLRTGTSGMSGDPNGHERLPAPGLGNVELPLPGHRLSRSPSWG